MRHNTLKVLSAVFASAYICTGAFAAPRQEIPAETNFSSQVQAPASAPVNVTVQGVFHELVWPQPGESQTTVKITKDTSHVFRFDRDIARVAVSNPLICDITTAGSRDVLVNAKEAGNANLVVWDRDENVATYLLESSLDANKLRQMLLAIDPDADLKIVPFNKTVAVYGETSTSLKLKQIQEATKAFDEKVVNYVRLRESKQVLLEVRFAEVDRVHNKDFKLDFQAITRYWSLNNSTGKTGAFSEVGEGTFSAENSVVSYETLQWPLGAQSIGNLFFPFISRSLYLTPYLEYLESKNILRVIARPNLLAKDGEEASFLVGGEYPVPTTSTSSGTTITYKDYGTSLKFTPEVLDNDLLRLKIAAEVSELDTTTSVTSGGVSVPGLTKRNQSTIAEMAENQSLVIAGIITQKVTKNNRKTPYLGDVPVLGRLFTADDYVRTDVELVVVITPHIVRPFQLEQAKTLYKPEDVREAVRIMAPPYPEKAADAMDRMFAQGEQFRDLKQDEKDIAEQMKADKIRARQEEQARRVSVAPAVSSKDYTNQRLKAPAVPASQPAPAAPAPQPAPSSSWSWPWKKPASAGPSQYSEADNPSGPVVTNFTSKIK